MRFLVRIVTSWGASVFIARDNVQLVAFLVDAVLTSSIDVATGEEDGSFDCAIAHTDGDFVATLTILVSGQSHHSW